MRAPVVAARPRVGRSGKGADRLLHLGSQGGELLRALTHLLAELRAELGLLLEQVRHRLGPERSTCAKRSPRLGETRLEDVTGHRIVEAGKELERAEALILRLAE